MKYRLAKAAGFVAALVLGLCSIVRADGFIVIHDPPAPRPDHFAFAPLEVTYHRVNVEINDHVAVTSVEQEFYNPNGRSVEGTYLFPLPDGAHIDKFSMDINGKQMPAELLDADKARAIYEEIVRKYRDPALLEYVGRGAMKVRIFPIEAHAKKQIKLQYTQLLKSDSGLAEYVYPLNTEKFSARPLNDVSVKVTIACSEPIKNVYSPSHTVDVRYDGDKRATLGFEQRNARPDTDFKVIFSRTTRAVGIDLLTYRANPSEDGYFMLMASPGTDVAQNLIQPKDICFVIDTSGSMAGPKLEQAKKALLFCLANLNDKDRFEIVRFSTEAEGLFGELKTASPENVKQASDFVSKFKPTGGTAIADALIKARAMKNSDPNRPCQIVFLTDGQPTIGETKEDRIVEIIKGQNATRIFSFGIGTDINTTLLDRIATETRALSQYVLPEEDIEVKVSSFYTKIQSPVLTNVEFKVDGGNVRLSKIYPNSMPDLFKGEMLVALGRYSGSGAASITIRGTLDGQNRSFTNDVTFVEKHEAQAFIPQLWATRRVGWLLDEIRLHGESKELKDEVVTLAREHGIVTPYTAYLILEDEQIRRVPLAQQSLGAMREDRDALVRQREVYDSFRLDSGVQEKAGRRAVNNAEQLNEMKYGWNSTASANGPAMPELQVSAGFVPAGVMVRGEGYKATTNYAQQVKVKNGRAFYQNGVRWTDATAQSRQNLPRKQVQFDSEDYYALVRKNPNVAQWLSLGTEVDVVIDDVIYEIR